MRERDTEDDRVSIPLDPETALRALLKVDPEAPPADAKPEHDDSEPPQDRQDN